LQSRQIAEQRSRARALYRAKVEEFFADGILSPAEQSLLKLEQNRLNLSDTDASEIEAQVKAGYQRHQENLANYRKTVVAELVHWGELGDQVRKVLKELQSAFGLSDTEAANILAAEIEQREVSQPKIFEFEVVTVNTKEQRMNRYNSLRERAITLRDAGKLAPVAVVEYFSAGIDSDFDEIEAKLNAFAQSTE
jgi:hypothetical protein